ncbi:MAG: ribonuclease III [Anaerolineae bacterium]
MPRSSSRSSTISAEPMPPAMWAGLYNLPFQDIGLLTEALTHSSYANEAGLTEAPNNERLEFLGDAVLGLVSGELAYHLLPGATEGEMTRLRVALVRREALADLARQVRLGEALRMSVGEIKTGGRNRDKMLADGFEALVGAIYLEMGLDAVRRFVGPMFDEMAEQTLLEQNQVDARSRFHYRIEAEHGAVPAYRVVSESGPEHNREYVVEVLVKGVVWGTGSGRSKQAASQAAAAEALTRLETPVDGS